MQTDGGPIGLHQNEELVKKVRKILDKCNIEVVLAQSYVDDIRWLLSMIEKGLGYHPEVQVQGAILYPLQSWITAT